MSRPFVNYIILADDDKDHAFIFRKVLHQVAPDKQVGVVHDGEALLSALKAVKPELLFLDLRMPCKHGLECLQAIRSNPSYDDMKVVIYSSSSQMSDIQKAYLHRANLYMVKPFTSEHLRNALETIFRKDSWHEAYLEKHYFINNRFVPFTASL